ncbi:Protein of unknown function (DUF3134) [Xenococcus sp. PCC 7305]|uniref:DUF3134 family protein n=1 Tax=Xenococcus sp. PCC 7305 TaxID=102125 RepID=UPI0002AC12FB|nr:DUF3134 family protein [Xenococcus sp. PCC 7305]ELS02427.1 Protein of unknown function (DUF3134) [Xenococcus sp. PCC 7305]
MEEFKNPALSQEARFEPAIVIPLKQQASLLDWLESNNRLIPREREPEVKKLTSSQDDVEELLDNDDYDTDLDED